MRFLLIPEGAAQALSRVHEVSSIIDLSKERPLDARVSGFALLCEATSRDDRPALSFMSPGSAGGGWQTWSYSELNRAVSHHEQVLRNIAAPGEVVAVSMAPVGESVATLIAAHNTRHPALLLPARLPDREAISAIEIVGAAILFVPSCAGGSPSRRGSWQRTTVRRAVVTTAFHPDDFIYQLTSGSMGSAKLAVRTSMAVSTEMRAVAGRLDVTNRDRVVCFSSIAHSYGLVGGLLAPLRVGAHVMLAKSPDDMSAFHLPSGPTITFGLAATYAALLALSGKRARPPTPDLRWALSAGAPLPTGLFEAARQVLDLTIRQDYGTTEAGTIALDVTDQVDPTTVGHTLDHVETKVLRSQPKSAVGTGDGELLVRSPAVAQRYLTREGSMSCLDHEGWFHTRDRCDVDADDRLVLKGRIRDPIVVGETTVPPEAIEATIARMPGVQEVVVVPHREPSGSTRVRAVVVAEGITYDNLRRWCSIYLDSPLRPASLEIRESLPRSPAGKVLLKYLV